MKSYYFMKSALDWLAKPAHFNRMMAVTLRVVGVLAVPFSLVHFFKAGKVIFGLPASEMLGGIFFQVFFIAAIYCVVHGLYIRARDIDVLPVATQNIFTLGAIVVRAIGETIAAFVALVSVGGGIFVWFTGKGVKTILDPLPSVLPAFGGTNFLGGIEFMVGGVLSAIALLGLSYLLAEGLVLVARAAQRPVVQQAPETPVTEISAEEPEYRRRSGAAN